MQYVNVALCLLLLYYDIRVKPSDSNLHVNIYCYLLLTSVSYYKNINIVGELTINCHQRRL